MTRLRPTDVDAEYFDSLVASKIFGSIVKVLISFHKAQVLPFSIRLVHSEAKKKQWPRASVESSSLVKVERANFEWS